MINKRINGMKNKSFALICSHLRIKLVCEKVIQYIKVLIQVHSTKLFFNSLSTLSIL